MALDVKLLNLCLAAASTETIAAAHDVTYLTRLDHSHVSTKLWIKLRTKLSDAFLFSVSYLTFCMSIAWDLIMSLLKEKLAYLPSKLHSFNKYLFHWNFYRIHLTYFIITIILASVILYGSNTSIHLSYSDAIFLCAWSMTNTGLNTIDLSILTAWQQAVLFLLMPMGDLTIVTVAVAYIRKHYLKKFLREFVQTNKVAQQLANDIEKAHEEEHQRKKDDETNAVPRGPNLKSNYTDSTP